MGLQLVAPFAPTAPSPNPGTAPRTDHSYCAQSSSGNRLSVHRAALAFKTCGLVVIIGTQNLLSAPQNVGQRKISPTSPMAIISDPAMIDCGILICSSSIEDVDDVIIAFWAHYRGHACR